MMRLGRLRAAMTHAGLEALVLLGPSNQEYVGIRQPHGDAMRMHYEPVLVVVSASDPLPHVWTPFPEGVRPEIDAGHVHPGLHLEYPEGIEAMVSALYDLEIGASRVGIDELTSPMIDHLASLTPEVTWCDAAEATGSARIVKTPDEITCIRRIQRINEVAMYEVEPALRPGVRQNELSGIFLEQVFELGASANLIDPIWNLTPLTIAGGTTTVNGDVGFPLSSNDRFLREGDLVMCDTGITGDGYHSDFGKTWICSVDPKPTARQRECFTRWQEVMEVVYGAIRPGATCGDLVRAAKKIEPKHSLAHFYLGHGIGCDSAEPPYIGSDLGIAVDDTIELVPGMVFVLEPVVWRDGYGGYRSEEMIVVTEESFERLSTYGYSPFA